MFFTINLPKQAIKINGLSKRYKFYALMRIRTYKYSPSELILNDFLLKNYHKSLKQLSFEIVARCKIQSNLSNSFTVVFQLANDDKLARLITYGNCVVKGSTILKDAFKRGVK